MRPGLIKPGNILRPPAALPEETSFNEARLDQAGKRWMTPSYRRVLAASMRPGLIKPGNTAPTRRCPQPTTRFNEARLDQAGKLRRDKHGNGSQSASIRPGLIKPGNASKPSPMNAPAFASMRPGL